jgi:hypothetical protein
MSEDKANRMNRRRFLERASTAGIILSGSTLLSEAAPKQPSRLSYDISRFSVTDPKLIGYTEQRRFTKVADRPRRIWAKPSGGFLLACGKGILEFSAEAEVKTELATSQPARCVAMDYSGNVYAGSKDGIHVFKEGKQTALWPAPDPQAWITAIEPHGEDVYVADSSSRLILRYDRSGKITKRIGGKDKERNVPGIILPSPYLDVKVAPDGLLRVNNTGRHCVELYTRDGDLELSWGKPTAAIEGFCGCCNPIALDVLPDGRYLTCEKGLPRVKIYSADGAFHTVVAGPETFPENSRHGAARDPIDGTMGGLDASPGPGGTILVLDLVTANVHVMKPKPA